MRQPILTLLLSLSTISIQSQVILSSCEASDSVKNLYINDAQQLTLNRLFEQNSTYIDSVHIPQSYTDTVLNAIIALHNVVGLPERDLVLEVYNIHVAEFQSLNRFNLNAYSGESWMQNLSNGNLNTGLPILDSIITNYGFTLSNYLPSFSGNNASAFFVSSENYNLKPITDTLANVSFVNWAESGLNFGDGPTIYDTIYPTFIELTYEYAWGDCPSGCMSHHSWKFRVYYDCSVEFIESYGSQLPEIVGIDNITSNALTISPNPFLNSITINGDDDRYDYRIYNLNGEQIVNGTAFNKSIELEKLVQGTYILMIERGDTIVIQRIVKM